MTQNAINNTASILSVDNLTLDGNTISSTDTNGDIILAPDGSGNVSVTSAPIVPSGDRTDSLGSNTNSWQSVFCNGITFDDGAHTLQNFEGDTNFTPELEFGGLSTGITYTRQDGAFSRVGDIIFISIDLLLSSKGSASGGATISGLPFTVVSPTPASLRWSLINLSASATAAVATFINGTSTMTLQEQGDNILFSNLNETEFSNTTELNIGGFYFA